MITEIKRDYYLEQLIRREGNGLIKIITGIRRCGKSYLLRTLFKNHLSACYSMYDIFCSGKNIGTWNRNRCGGIYNGEGC